MQAPRTSCRCRKSHKVKQGGQTLPILSGVLIALLPKCPFCIMAYSSAITLCSSAKLYDHNPTWVSYISIGLAAFTLLLVLWNYKGLRTWLAAVMILVGCYFILDSELRTGDFTNYYWGAFGLLMGVWVIFIKNICKHFFPFLEFLDMRSIINLNLKTKNVQ